MNWLQHHPDDLIERFEPAEALSQLRQQKGLTPQQLLKLDVYLHHWTLVLLQRANDPQGVQEMLTLCEIASDLVPEDVQGHAMRQRWSGFEDLLEAKRRTLQASGQVAPVALKQQDTILQIIQQATGGRVKQLDLVSTLQLSKGRVSQILGVLESRALITRQREGKESWVSLAKTHSAPLAPVQGKATAASSHIGANVFALRKAA
jgi:DNA-binding transcriptional ArsR family regulator